LLWIVDVDDESSAPVPVVIVLGQKSDAGFFAPGEAGITLLGARDFDGGRIERRL
jgi:hypothetical protein